MPISFRSLVSIMGVLTAIGSTTAARAEKCNLFKQPQANCCFNIVVAGNATQNNNVDICKTCNDPATNPFASCPSHSCSATFDSATNTTTFTFCPGSACTPHLTNGADHFGLDGGGGGTVQILSGSWNCSTNSTNATGNLGTGKAVSVCAVSTTATVAKPGASSKGREPVSSGHSPHLAPVMQGPLDTNPNLVSVTTQQSPGANPNFFIVYVRGTQTSMPGSADGAGIWVEQPYPSGQAPAFQFENNTADPIWLNDVGILLNGTTEILIGDLNFDSLPPPGQPNSRFTALPCLDGVELAVGETRQIPLSCPTLVQNNTGAGPVGSQSPSNQR